ncbi:MAG TPA: hypothetical protein DCS09_05320 [Porphyromonadaceae bacterium]|nr:hypothetical protein [Porphyromonadaceae bacterium]HII65325.1 hypothetical protein [Candidatus Woesearchaeota archaeon]
MTLDNDLKNQSTVINLVSALNVSRKERDFMVESLSRKGIYELLQHEGDIAAVKEKLSGRRIPLTPEQHVLATVIRYQPSFDATIGSWLKQRKRDEAYAVEFILGHYDVKKGRLTDAGTSADIASKASFEDMKALRKHSIYAGDLGRLYKWENRAGKVNFNREAQYVARALIGRSLDVDVSREYEGRTAQIIETEAFETSDKVTRSRYCMLAAPGQIDVMPHRGQNLLNVGSDKLGTPSCVMIRSVVIGENIIEGPGRVGSALQANNLGGLVLGINIPLEGTTASSGFIPGNVEYSLGRYRMQHSQ